MTTLTVYADAADGYCESSDSVYATARAGTGTLTADTTFAGILIGQYFSTPTYGVYQAYVSFDTSALGSSATISAVSLSLLGFTNHTDTDFTIEARLWDWGVSLTTADFVAGANLSGKTRLGTFATSGYTTVAYNTFTEDGTNFQTNISKTASTRFLLASDRTAANTAPTGFEYLQVYSADQTGTTNDPKLVVTYTASITTTVTPSTLSLTTSLKTPTIFQQLRAKPASLANSISLKTPTVVLAQAVRPASLALVTARFAPTVPLVFKPKPTTLALTLNGQTPVLFKILTLKTSAILEAQYADSQTLESLYAATGTIEAQYADSQTLEAF